MAGQQGDEHHPQQLFLHTDCPLLDAAYESMQLNAPHVSMISDIH